MSSSLSVKSLSNQNFDYSSLDAETLYFIQEQTGEIRTLMKRTAQDIINIGQKLIEIKKRLGYGQYRKWIETEFNWGKSTANSFENVARHFADVHNLDIFAPSALYELAAPSTPESARQEAMAKAQAGEKIGYKLAKEIKKKHITKKENQQPISKQQVINIHPQEAELNPDVSSETTKINSLSENDSILIEPESCWQLGENHLIYCGDPHSSKLQAQLPERIALAICFPPVANWHLGNLEPKVHSSLILFSHYKDVDLKLLRDIVRNALEIYTSAEERVMFSFLPDPALLILAEQLFCCCAIAEPDPKRCQAVVQAWIQTGGKVTQKM